MMKRGIRKRKWAITPMSATLQMMAIDPAMVHDRLEAGNGRTEWKAIHAAIGEIGKVLVAGRVPHGLSKSIAAK
jgi:hypothetical protein